jgi:hypothetical protein
MWEVDNSTPFAAIGDWIRDRDGSEVWVVAVRCSFRIREDGGTYVEPKQQEVVLAPVFAGDPERSHLVYDSDFCLSKPTTDIILHGHAYAPGGEPTARVDVGMAVGDVRKVLTVVGDRIYEKGVLGLGVSSAEPFAKMPIAYERSFGGRNGVNDEGNPDFFVPNPIGTGFERKEGTPAPNILPYNSSVQARAGFGPLPSHWPDRLQHAGTYDDAWQRNRMPLYPDDLDDRFFLCSPIDQRPAGHLRGGELVRLLNLTPSGSLDFQLPQVALRFETEFRGRPSRIHRGSLHTVILEPDDSRVIMVWQTALKAHADVVRLRRTKVLSLKIINPRPLVVPEGLWDIDESEVAG